jgi:antagonist of KipI
MSVLIRKPGILTTVQDLGRTGARRLGINPNGAMDTVAARAINIALGNDENSSVLEMHFPAVEIEFTQDTSFAISGADFGAELNGKSISNWQAAYAGKGSVLKFHQKFNGNRAYLAVKGGFKIDEWQGSTSTNIAAGVGGISGRALIAGDTIECESLQDLNSIFIGRSLIPRYSRFPTLRIVAGGEFKLLSAVSERILLNEMFTLTKDSNRMGYRLDGEQIHLLHEKELISSATSFGTVQLLPDGQMVILMADHQTSGGYPRVGNIISADLPIAAQLGPGDRIGFKIVSVGEAEEIAMKLEHELTLFKVACRLRQQQN